MKILFESYCYDKSLEGKRYKDPYSVNYSVECESLKEAAHHAAYDLMSFYKNEWQDYGGAVVIINDKCVYDAFPSGNVVFHDCAEFERLFREELKGIEIER